MNQVLYTRCPYCRTAFRTSAQQLSLRSGQVRCGNCRKIFNAGGHLVKLEPSPFLARPEYELEEDYDPMKGPQTMTLRRPIAEPAPTPKERELAAQTRESEERSESMARASFDWGRRAEAPTRLGWLYAALFPILLILLAAQ